MKTAHLEDPVKLVNGFLGSARTGIRRFHRAAVPLCSRGALTGPVMFANVRVSSTMLILRGSPALSDFRLQKLLQDISAAKLPVRAISARFVHVAELSAKLSAGQQEVLEKLLTYGPSRTAAAIDGLVQVV